MPPERPRRFHVLVVEDNPADGEIIAERLETAAPGWFEIVHVLDMMRAGRACAERAFDCVVLDLQLPDTTGAQTIEAMRALCPSVAIIAYSGMDNEASRSAALTAGAEHFVSKNVGDAGLIGHVLSALERSDCATRRGTGDASP